MTSSDFVAAAPPEPVVTRAVGPDASWNGLGMLTGGKGYVNAPLGQLHYRDVGPTNARFPMLLFHQTPSSIVEFGAAQNFLFAHGLRSIAVDTPGYGMSDQPVTAPTVAEFADNMVALLDALELRKVVACGHHTGASIAAAMAARHPTRIAGVILHGCALYTPEEADQARGKVLWDCTPTPDGAHMSQLFKWQRFGDEAELLNLTWMSVCLFLQGADFGHWAVNRHDFERDLRSIRAPGMILTEVDDITHLMDQRASDVRPDFRFEVVDARGNSMLFGNPEEWAARAASFMATLAGKTRRSSEALQVR